MAIPGQRAVYDERRNSSHVFPVPPGAVDEADRALRRWAAENPSRVLGILDGAPTLTHAEHVARFGVPYERTRAKRVRG